MENIGKKYDGFTFTVPVHHKQELISKVLSVLAGLDSAICHFYPVDTIWIDNIIVESGDMVGNPNQVHVRATYADGSEAFSCDWYYWKNESGGPSPGWQLPGFLDPSTSFIREQFLSMYQSVRATLTTDPHRGGADDPESSPFYSGLLDIVYKTISLLSFR